MKDLSLKDFFNEYPHITLGTSLDNQDILEFYHQTSLSSSESKIIYTRGNDFFSFLKERGESSLVLLLKDDAGKIVGMGVISYRQGYIHGELQTIGYLGDLRVKMNRKLIREWRLMYANLMRLSPQMKETHFCRYYQTVLIDENLESKNNLAETKIPNLHYEKIQRYKMINIIGRFKLRSSSYYVRFATNEDRQLILNFLIKNTQKELFSHHWEVELDHRLKAWSHFDLTHFLLAFDKSGNLLGVSSLWNPIKSKQIRITKISHVLKLSHSLGKLAPFLELKKFPEENTPLEILYLNQVCFLSSLSKKERKDLLLDMIHFSFQKDFHMLAYADFENENYLEDAKSLFMQKMPMALFSVHYKNNAGEIVNPLEWIEGMPTSTFDMSLV